MTQGFPRAAGAVIETERLRLRRFTPADADALYEVFADPDARRFYPAMADRAGVLGWIERNIERYARWGFGLWALELKETGELIGDCGLSFQDVEGAEELEVGYHVHHARRRRGFASESARACLEFGFRNTPAPRIGSIVAPANAASRAVASRLHTSVRDFTGRDGPLLFYFTRRSDWERSVAKASEGQGAA